MNQLNSSQTEAVSGAEASSLFLGFSAAMGLYLGCKKGASHMHAVESPADLIDNLGHLGSAAVVGVISSTILATLVSAYQESTTHTYTDPNHVFVRRYRG